MLTQQHPLLATKIFIPMMKPTQISRTRLLDRLNNGFTRGCRMTLISAPAGYGKTSLVAEWLHRLAGSGVQMAWLSLDDGDNDPVRFQRYVIAALQKVDASFGQGVTALLDLPGTALQDTLAMFINEMAEHTQRFILVLDDYHLIHSLEIHDWVNRLLENQPPNLHIVLATRSDPLLRLARLRAHGQTIDIRSEDIRFTSVESNQFLTGSMGLALSTEAFERLDNQVEGWAAGLQLAALAAAVQPEGSGLVLDGERYFMDYLFEEVFCYQPADVQEFLLKTSVLERMNCSICAALYESGNAGGCGDSGVESRLEELERANLFIVPLDSQHEWYRYHHLFAGLLRKRLNRTYGPEEVKRLKLAASFWCEEHQQISEAISYALAAENDERVAVLLETYAMGLLQRTATPLPPEWLSVIERMDLSNRPLLCVVAAFVELFKRPEPPGPLEARLSAIERALEKQDASSSQTEVVKGYLAALKSALGRIRGASPAEIIEQAETALRLLPGDARLARFNAARALYSAFMIRGEPESAKLAIDDAIQIASGGSDEYHYMSSIFSKAHVTAYQGCLKEAAQVCRKGIDITHPLESGGRPYLGAGTLHLWHGLILLEWNDLEAAANSLIAGVEGLRYLAEPYMLMRGWAWLGKLNWLRGERARAELFFERSRSTWPGAGRYVDGQMLRLLLMSGDDAALEAGAQWAHGHVLDGESFPIQNSMLLEGEWHFMDQMTLARWMIAKARMHHAVDLTALLDSLQIQQQAAGSCGWGSREVEVLLLKALTYDAARQAEPARTALHKALTMAEPHGYVRLFVDEGRPMQNMLQALRHRSEIKQTTAYMDRLLAVLEAPQAVPIDQTFITLADGTIVEPLTEREAEVLRLISLGLSNADIAARLVLSTNTLKAHTQNIYHKLDAHSRLQAVNRAKEAGLLAH